MEAGKKQKAGVRRRKANSRRQEAKRRMHMEGGRRQKDRRQDTHFCNNLLRLVVV